MDLKAGKDMINFQQFNRISQYEWELPASTRKGMNHPVRFFVTGELLKSALSDQSIDQAINASMLPGLAAPVVVMPDVHQGYGFPIGGVAAFSFSDGIISPGAIGYDINCGVRLMASSIQAEEAEPYMSDLSVALEHFCPTGVGSEGNLSLSAGELDQVCHLGARWTLKKGMASEEDLKHTEDNGCLEGADPSQLSPRARERGLPQLGTLGSGNHFIEVGRVEQIFEVRAAQAFGLFEGCLVLLIHSGSRGLGHQVCTDYVNRFQRIAEKYKLQLPDRELVCAPIESMDGKSYLAAMRSAANYAFANRQVLAYQVRKAFESVFAGKVKNWHLHQVYDITHNMGNVETHTIQGKSMKVCVHRKGATRAFGPQSPGIPLNYKAVGQPVLVPGSMGTSSWVLVGTEASMEKSLGSSCHGAGRVFSRSKAKKEVRGEDIHSQLARHGIIVRAKSMKGLAEEAPQAYKDVDEIIETVVGAGIVRKVARLRPIVVIKG